MDVDLQDVGALNIDVFELFGCDILSLRQLENVLGTIDNANASICQDHSNITRKKPAIDQRLLILFIVLEVAFED